MCGHTRDPVIYSNFHRNPSRNPSVQAVTSRDEVIVVVLSTVCFFGDFDADTDVEHLRPLCTLSSVEFDVSTVSIAELRHQRRKQTMMLLISATSVAMI